MTDPGLQLRALADPTRRAIFDLVLDAPSSVRVLSDQLPVSQPAVSQHLRVLREASLVKRTPLGGRHVYTADPAGVGALREWVQTMWEDVLDAFVAAAHEQQAEKG